MVTCYKYNGSQDGKYLGMRLPKICASINIPPQPVSWRIVPRALKNYLKNVDLNVTMNEKTKLILNVP